MGAEKWRTLRQQNKIPVKTQTETKGGKKSGRGIRTSNKGDILFVAARNFFLDYIPELKISESKQNVLDTKIIMEPVVTNGAIISNIEGKSKLNDENATEMMVAESLDLSLDACSISESVSLRKEWSMLVNNTHYIGNERPNGKSSFVVMDEIKDDYVIQSETKNERNRRLLLQHQETYGCPDKGRNCKRPSNSLRHVKRLQEIKEEDTRDEKYRSKQEGSRSTRANKSEKKAGINDNTVDN